MHIDRRVAVGVEIGGGQTTIALIDAQGQVCRRELTKTLRGRPAVATLEPYLRAIDSVLAYARAAGYVVCGLGLSIPGSLDEPQRRPQMVPLLPAFNNFPLGDFLETRYQLPTYLHADVDAAALGELRFGAGRDVDRLLFLNVNAVVGAALIVDGQPMRSAQPYVGHVCHLLISTSGPRCSCGKRGCINTLVSLDALQRSVQRALRRGDETTLLQRVLNGDYFSPQLLTEEAARGDGVALQIYGEMTRWLGTAIARYLDLFEPHRLILSGSIIWQSNGYLLDRLKTAVPDAKNHSSSSRVCSVVDVVPACLGRDAALIGSAASAFV